jgi:hypothetical protein
VRDAPTIEAEGKVLQLNINNASLPPVTEVNGWLKSIGVAPEAHADARKVLEGLWKAWQENGVVRLGATLSADGKSM